MTAAIGVEPECPFTPSVLKKIVYAGVQASSFVQATKDLSALAELSVSRERVQRWTKRIGQERSAQQKAAAQAYQALPLPAQRGSPSGQSPAIACVQMDGGRMQVRERSGAAKSSAGHWRETLVGCLLSMQGEESANDPCPAIPETFVDPQRMANLSREIQGFRADAEPEDDSPEAAPADRPGRPQVLVRSVLATRGGVDVFGPRLVAAAHARGFHAARRKAFVADGSATNWGVHRQYFSHYTAILDFTHAICYVYAAAMTGRTAAEGWSEYRRWAAWLWQGEVDALIAALQVRANELGAIQDNDAETTPRRVLAETVRYITNQRSRMRYADYRLQGLPITSSHIESTIKRVNRRIK